MTKTERGADRRQVERRAGRRGVTVRVTDADDDLPKRIRYGRYRRDQTEKEKQCSPQPVSSYS